jgi:hypothetical protein
MSASSPGAGGSVRSRVHYRACCIANRVQLQAYLPHCDMVTSRLPFTYWSTCVAVGIVHHTGLWSWLNKAQVMGIKRASNITLNMYANRVLKVEHIKLEVLISNGRETTPGSRKICTVLFCPATFPKRSPEKFSSSNPYKNSRTYPCRMLASMFLTISLTRSNLAMTCLLQSTKLKLLYLTPVVCENAFTSSEPFRKLWRGTRGKRWCTAWNCRPPWNQSSHSGQSTSMVVRSWC